MESSEKIKDVIIIGGGLVGGLLAQTLSYHKFDVAVVDIEDPQALLSSREDHRSYALSQGTKHIFDAVGLWDGLKDKSTPIEIIKVATSVEGPFLTYNYQEVGDEPLGYLINATQLRRHILTSNLTATEWIAPQKVDTIETHDSHVSVCLEGGQTLTARLAIGADGNNSWCRKALNIPTFERPYTHKALVFNVTHQEPHHNQAFEIFTPEGPFAMLPYPDNTSGCVWFLEADKADAMRDLSEDDFNKTLNRRFKNLLGALNLAGPLNAYPLNLKIPHTPVAPRFALVGDAAHTLHPVAGQGVNLGFRDVDILTKLLVEARELGLDIGSVTTLSQYRNKRLLDVGSMMFFTDTMARMFNHNFTFLHKLGSHGLRILDRLPFVKRPLIRHAMGI